jgi:hypothetical protein
MIPYDEISQQIVGSPTSLSQLKCIRNLQLLSSTYSPKNFSSSVGISYLLSFPVAFFILLYF